MHVAGGFEAWRPCRLEPFESEPALAPAQNKTAGVMPRPPLAEKDAASTDAWFAYARISLMALEFALLLVPQVFTSHPMSLSAV